MSAAKFEQKLKWLAVALGVASTIAIVQDWDPWPMVLGLPFCLIWIYCAWLHTERQLKWLNVLFTGLYSYGLVRYFMW
ncbi:MAG: peptidase [Pseudomonadota bacterium]